MKLFRTLISWEKALQTVLRHVPRMAIEEIRFEDALNRVLAEDIRSPIDSPPFDRAAMDGYAIRGEDSFGASPDKPVMLRLTRSSVERGGQKEEGEEEEEEEEAEEAVEVAAGECFPIATGMPLPKGTNAVIMLEYTKQREDLVELFKPVTPGKNVSLKGEDVKKGEVVLHAGKILRAHDLGMLASLFQRTVRVYKRAEIGIIATGDELIDPSAVQSPGHEQRTRHQKIADANSYTLAALTQPIANPHRMGIVPDRYEAVKNALWSSCDEYAVLFVSGGSSVGTRDYLADAVEELGELLFHGVAIRPGEPTGFGMINSKHSKPVFLLPGYPVATIAAFELLVRPFLSAMHGVKDARITILAHASHKIPSAVGRTDFVRVKLHRTDRGYSAEPVRATGSGILSSMTRSDGFVIIPEHKEGIEAGELVEVTEYSSW
ncbi:MAG: molybdopterin molybdenumtransferase MoeA [Methanophagales archaeon ANME-1-THS]|nr:MAG: molybdopterin molybdenumtransferase MoeA [Methanophagales archaeon ANME-1-THS]